MVTLTNLTDDDVRQHLGLKLYQRAATYVSRVVHMIYEPELLTAQVMDRSAYQVEIYVEDNEILSDCSCSERYEIVCRHGGAALLKWLTVRDAVLQRKPNAKSAVVIYSTNAVELPEAKIPAQKPYWVETTPKERHDANIAALAESLNSYVMQDLRKRASRWGVPIKGSRKRDLLQQFEQWLLQSENNLQLLENASHATKEEIKCPGSYGDKYANRSRLSRGAVGHPSLFNCAAQRPAGKFFADIRLGLL